LILPIFLMTLMGVFEYGRFIMIRNLADNAVREGARFAVVHTYDRTTAQIQAAVLAKLVGQDAQLGTPTVQVFKSDPTSGVSVGPWTDAQFGDCIKVQLNGPYRPAVPAFLGMNSSIAFQAQAVMRSEAN